MNILKLSVILLLVLGCAVGIILYLVLGNNSDDEDVKVEKFCYAKNDKPYLLMGTRTSYNVGRGNLTRLPPESNCKPVQMWAFIRHGATSLKNVEKFLRLRHVRDEILENHANGTRGHLCQEDLEKLSKWDADPELEPHELTPRGEVDARLVAQRLKAIFPELLDVDPSKASQKDFHFRTTNEGRTQQSMKAFMEGLFNSADAVEPIKLPLNDTILHGVANCTEYWKSLEYDKIKQQTDILEHGPIFKKLKRAVSERLGFEVPLNKSTVQAMYETCRHEKSGRIDGESPWCAVFSDEDIRVFEYIEDMGECYMAGPCRTINKRLGCAPTKDMMDHFKRLENSKNINSEPKAVFYFGHSKNMATFIAGLGIAEDYPPPLASNYELQGNRKYRTSLKQPFSGNVVAVFYKCDDKKVPYRVGLSITERPFELPGCDNNDGCDWKVIKQRYEISECNMDFCNYEKVAQT